MYMILYEQEYLVNALYVKQVCTIGIVCFQLFTGTNERRNLKLS